jgi:hypothetical protein
MNGGSIIQEGILWHPKIGRKLLKEAARHFRSEMLLASTQPLHLSLNPQDRLPPPEEEQLAKELNLVIIYDREIPQGAIWCSRRSLL